MDKRSEQLQQLTDIRNMMEHSSRFKSISGLSGIGAGIIALLGVLITFSFLDSSPFDTSYISKLNDYNYSNWGIRLVPFFMVTAIGIFGLSSLVGFFFTLKRTKTSGQNIWGDTSKRVFGNGFLPMIVGSFFCLALMSRHCFDLIVPASLIFYGLSCVNASKYTISEIFYLGIFEIILGVIGLFTTEYGIEIWAIGFGFLHIGYGIVMYIKYESSQEKA